MCALFAEVTLRFLVLALAVGQQSDRVGKAADGGHGAITGVTMRDAPGVAEPVRRASVELYRNGVLERVLLSSDGGLFEFNHLLDGNYSVVARKKAYVDSSYGSKGEGLPGALIAVRGDRHQVAIIMQYGAVLSGIVTTTSGKPASGLEISALRVGRGGRVTKVMTTTTDDRGVYRLYGLPSADYLISASTPLLATQLMRGEVEAPTVNEVDAILARLGKYGAGKLGRVQLTTTRQVASSARVFAPVYFPGTPDIAEATTITAGDGREQLGLDFGFVPAKTAAVSGLVVGGANLTIQVTLEPVGLSLSTIVSSRRAMLAGRDGEFAFGAVPPGKYRVAASARSKEMNESGSRSEMKVLGRGPQTAAQVLYATADIDATNGEDVNGVSLVLQPGGSLRGRVTIVGQPPRRDLNAGDVQLLLAPVGVSPAPAGMAAQPSASRSVRPLRTGGFNIADLVPASYTLRVSIPEGLSRAGWIAQSAIAGGVDLLDGPFDLRAGQSLDQVIVTVTNATGTVAGTLVTAGGEPVPDYVVLLYSADKRLWNVLSRRTRLEKTATNGSFTFTGLPAGEFLLCALPSVDANEIQDGILFERMADSAKIVHVPAGQTTTLTLTGGK